MRYGTKLFVCFSAVELVADYSISASTCTTSGVASPQRAVIEITIKPATISQLQVSGANKGSLWIIALAIS